MRAFLLWTWCSFALCVYYFYASVAFIVAWSGDPGSIYSIIIASVLLALSLATGGFSGQITYYQIEHLYAGQTVKMRHKQGKLNHFNDDTKACSGRFRRFHTNVLCWLWSYSPRPSLLDVEYIRKAQDIVPRVDPLDSLLTLELDKHMSEDRPVSPDQIDRLSGMYHKDEAAGHGMEGVELTSVATSV